MSPLLRNVYANQIYIHPFVLIFLIIAILVVLAFDKKYVVLIFLLTINFITPAQRISISGIDFPIIRILFLVALLRIFLRREYSEFRITLLDKIIFFQIAISTLAYSLQVPSFSSVTFAASTFIDSFSAYFIIRCLIKDEKDIRSIITELAWISFVVAFLFLYEVVNRHNLMSILGWVPETPEIRHGQIRAQGAYAHPILAGAYWAAVFPLFIGSCIKGEKKVLLMYLGVVSSIIIIVLSSSSTSISSFLVGIIASLFYFQRDSLTFIKLLLIFSPFVLSIFMDNPIWFLLTKIDFTGGSTGFFRYLLLDNFIRNWKEWFFLGIRNTGQWGTTLSLPWVGLNDLTNQFVVEGVRGGIFGLTTFIFAIVIAFKYFGKLLSVADNKDTHRLYWYLGTSLLVHITNFIGISYFSQEKMAWWMALAFSACLIQNRVELVKTTKLM